METTATQPEALTVAAVARQLGVAAATLRTWDRRYQLGPSQHCAGTHRRYTSQDLARLTLMRRLVILGVPAAEAAASARAFEGDLTAARNTPVSTTRTGDRADPEALFRAAKAMDREVVEKIVSAELATCGVVDTWDSLLVPVLIQVGILWQESGSGVAVEHFLTEILKRLLAEPVNQLHSPINSRPVLLACVGEESHSLPIKALAAGLAEVNIESQFLGARTPLSALLEVARRVAPPAIFLWAQLNENADLAFIHELPAFRPAPRIIIGGPGWNGRTCEHAHLAGDLAMAIEEISGAIGA